VLGVGFLFFFVFFLFRFLWDNGGTGAACVGLGILFLGRVCWVDGIKGGAGGGNCGIFWKKLYICYGCCVLWNCVDGDCLLVGKERFGLVLGFMDRR
jgi:hypothetical protein